MDLDDHALSIESSGAFVIGVAASLHRYVGVYEGTPGSWTYTQLDAGPTTSSMSDPAVAIAPDGTVHVSFWRKGTTIGEVKHAWRDANGWHVEVIGQTMRAMTSYTSMAAAPDGTLQVFYAKDQTSPPVYAENDGTGWVPEDLPATCCGAGGRFSGAQTPTGHPMVVYQKSFDIRFIWRDTNDAWQTKLLAAGIFVSPSLAVASDGRPHVVYSELDHGLVGPVPDYRAGKQSYATPLDANDLAGTWITEHIGIPGDLNDLSASIAVDPNGRPAIAAITAWTGYPNPLNPAVRLPIPETLRVYSPVT